MLICSVLTYIAMRGVEIGDGVPTKGLRWNWGERFDIFGEVQRGFILRREGVYVYVLGFSPCSGCLYGHSGLLLSRSYGRKLGLGPGCMWPNWWLKKVAAQGSAPRMHLPLDHPLVLSVISSCRKRVKPSMDFVWWCGKALPLSATP